MIDPTGELAPRSQHIREMLADLYSALDEGRPWSLVRLGDGELQVLDGLHVPWPYCENRCATLADAGDLRDLSIEAVRNADWVGWHQDRWFTEHFERLGFLPEIYEWSQYAWVNLHMGIRRGFVERVLRNERLYLAGEPMERWTIEILHPAGLGQEAVVYAGPTTVETMAHARLIAQAGLDSGVTVALISLGVWALPVCEMLRAGGMVAVDYGHAPGHNLLPESEAHGQYRLNTCCEDSPQGTMEHYRHAGAPTCLPE